MFVICPYVSSWPFKSYSWRKILFRLPVVIVYSHLPKGVTLWNFPFYVGMSTVTVINRSCLQSLNFCVILKPRIQTYTQNNIQTYTAFKNSAIFRFDRTVLTIGASVHLSIIGILEEHSILSSMLGIKINWKLSLRKQRAKSSGFSHSFNIESRLDVSAAQCLLGERSLFHRWGLCHQDSDPAFILLH